MALDESLSEVLAENYLGIGAIGMEIIGSVIDDLAQNRYDNEWVDAMDITRDDLSRELFSLIRSVIEGGYLNSMRTASGWVGMDQIIILDQE
jgi:hypothetical protein